jgi:hypothetical protein
MINLAFFIRFFSLLFYVILWCQPFYFLIKKLMMSISHILYHAQFLVKIIFHMCFKYKNVNDSINIEKKSILYIYIYIYKQSSSRCRSGKNLRLKGLISLWFQVRARWLLIWWPLEAYIVVNFKAHGISRSARKLVRTPTLIKKN